MSLIKNKIVQLAKATAATRKFQLYFSLQINVLIEIELNECPSRMRIASPPRNSTPNGSNLHELDGKGFASFKKKQRVIQMKCFRQSSCFFLWKLMYRIQLSWQSQSRRIHFVLTAKFEKKKSSTTKSRFPISKLTAELEKQIHTLKYKWHRASWTFAVDWHTHAYSQTIALLAFSWISLKFFNRNFSHYIYHLCVQSTSKPFHTDKSHRIN